MKEQAFLIFASILILSNVCQASLVDNGGGLIYDTDLNITWLQEPNNTPMNWRSAYAWVATLTTGGEAAGTWRLPASSATMQSEMAHLYFTELGNAAGGPLSNKGFFTNLRLYDYWSNEYAPGSDNAWYFCFIDGKQSSAGPKDIGTAYALAVHDGNIGPNGHISHAPIPGALWLFAPGLAGLIGLRRKHLG